MIKKSSLGDLIVNTNSRILSISIFFSFLTINLNVSLFRIIYTIYSAMIFSPSFDICFSEHILCLRLYMFLAFL